MFELTYTIEGFSAVIACFQRNFAFGFEAVKTMFHILKNTVEEARIRRLLTGGIIREVSLQ